MGHWRNRRFSVKRWAPLPSQGGHRTLVGQAGMGWILVAVRLAAGPDLAVREGVPLPAGEAVVPSVVCRP